MLSQKEKNRQEQILKQNKFYRIIAIVLGILAVIFLAAALAMRGQFNREKSKYDHTLQTANSKISKQADQITTLQNTQEMRSFNSAKQQTDDALNNVLNALYTWNGQDFAKRYAKASKYLTHDELLGLTTNGQMPTKKEIRETAKAYADNNANSKLTEMQNGIQSINGNSVQGFVWITSTFTEFGKNSTLTVQALYTYDLGKEKFTQFELEPFSGTVNN